MAKIRYCLKESLEQLTEQEHEKILNDNRISYLFENLQKAKENVNVSANNLAQIIDKILASPFFILELEVDTLSEKALWRLRKIREILNTFEDGFRKDEMFHYTELIEKRLIKRKCETEQLFPVRRSIEVDIENDPLANLIKKRLDTVCLGTIDETKGPTTGEPESQPAAKVSIDGKEAPATGPAGQNPPSVLSQRQLALHVYYLQAAREMEAFENMGFSKRKEAIWSFAGRIPKEDGTKRSGQGFYDELRILKKQWLDESKQETQLRNFEAPTKENEDDHREILKHLEPSSKAYKLAKCTFEKIVTP